MSYPPHLTHTGFLLQFDRALSSGNTESLAMGLIFFAVYFDIFNESDVIYLCKYDSRCERDSVYRVFDVNQCMEFSLWHLMFSHFS